MGMPVGHLDDGREPSNPYRRRSTNPQSQTPSEGDNQTNLGPSSPPDSADNQTRQQGALSSQGVQRRLEVVIENRAATTSATDQPSSPLVLNNSGPVIDDTAAPSPAPDAPASASTSLLFVIAGPTSNADDQRQMDNSIVIGHGQTAGSTRIRIVDARRMQRILAIVEGPPSDEQREPDGTDAPSSYDRGVGDATSDISDDQPNGGI
ncbi:MAG: hypothetical protein M1812_001463 [Candelaria pacifica]|nr:MAG: hypothetical protein M1812_001463 [Candelaria pacifica]